MGRRFNGIAEKIGAGLPAGDRRTAEDALDGLLDLSRSEESRLACRNLCTCHVRANDDRGWTRLLELVEDPDPLVRRELIHALADSTPAPCAAQKLDYVVCLPIWPVRLAR